MSTPTYSTSRTDKKSIVRGVLFLIALILSIGYGRNVYHSYDVCKDNGSEVTKGVQFSVPAGYHQVGPKGELLSNSAPQYGGSCVPNAPVAAERHSDERHMGRSVEALLLMHECVTPCSANIAWRFKIRTEGHPVEIKFNGVHDAVTYPGEGDFQAPTDMRSGKTEFSSTDKDHPNVRVQVYKKITVEER